MSLMTRTSTSVLTVVFRRNLGAAAILSQKVPSDPIQKLFVQKVREYDQKAKASPGKLVDSNPRIEQEYKAEMDRISKIYGGGANVDMTKFPSFNFAEPVVDPINQAAEKK